MYRKLRDLPVDRLSDFSRLARFLTGTSVGLVLGGGGARWVWEELDESVMIWEDITDVVRFPRLVTEENDSGLVSDNVIVGYGQSYFWQRGGLLFIIGGLGFTVNSD